MDIPVENTIPVVDNSESYTEKQAISTNPSIEEQITIFENKSQVHQVTDIDSNIEKNNVICYYSPQITTDIYEIDSADTLVAWLKNKVRLNCNTIKQYNDNIVQIADGSNMVLVKQAIQSGIIFASFCYVPMYLPIYYMIISLIGLASIEETQEYSAINMLINELKLPKVMENYLIGLFICFLENIDTNHQAEYYQNMAININNILNNFPKFMAQIPSGFLNKDNFNENQQNFTIFVSKVLNYMSNNLDKSYQNDFKKAQLKFFCNDGMEAIKITGKYFGRMMISSGIKLTKNNGVQIVDAIIYYRENEVNP